MERFCKRNKRDPIDDGNINGPTNLNESDNSPNFVLLLPQELILKIFSELDIQSLTNAAMTCGKWNDLIEDDDFLWRDHCLTTLAVCESELLRDQANGFSWKVNCLTQFEDCKL